MQHISGESIILRVWRWPSLFLPLLLFSMQAAAGVGFNAPVKYAVGGSPFLRAVADFNGDGRPDLATSAQTNQRQRLRENLLYGGGGARVHHLCGALR